MTIVNSILADIRFIALKGSLFTLNKLPVYFFLFLSLIWQNTLLAVEPSSQILTSHNKRPILLEVYTSQGCSSCPPAEKWLNKINEKSAKYKLWKDIIPINFHVDYWDYLGWKDPFANKKFTIRQRDFAKKGYAKTIATPGFILDGKGWNGWFNGSPFPLELAESPGKLTATINQQVTKINYQTKSVKQGSNSVMEVHVAILGFDQATKVRKGENKGEELKHDYVVIAYDNDKLTYKNESYQTEFSLPKSKDFTSIKQAVVIWISDENDPRPVQVVANWL